MVIPSASRTPSEWRLDAGAVVRAVDPRAAYLPPFTRPAERHLFVTPYPRQVEGGKPRRAKVTISMRTVRLSDLASRLQGFPLV